jgi:hypothetical protein
MSSTTSEHPVAERLRSDRLSNAKPNDTPERLAVKDRLTNLYPIIYKLAEIGKIDGDAAVEFQRKLNEAPNAAEVLKLSAPLLNMWNQHLTNSPPNVQTATVTQVPPVAQHVPSFAPAPQPNVAQAQPVPQYVPQQAQLNPPPVQTILGVLTEDQVLELSEKFVQENPDLQKEVGELCELCGPKTNLVKCATSTKYCSWCKKRMDDQERRRAMNLLKAQEKIQRERHLKIIQQANEIRKRRASQRRP